LERFGIDPNDWIVRCLCGSVLIRTIYLGHRTAKVFFKKIFFLFFKNFLKIMLISRLSFEHVGTRFNVRGINVRFKKIFFCFFIRKIFADSPQKFWWTFLNKF